MSQVLYDTVIIGGGPAGAAAAVYAARKKMKTLVIAEEFGGQSIVSAGIENWIGESKITGIELAEKLEKHVRAQEDIEVKMPEKVIDVQEEKNRLFEVRIDRGMAYHTKTLIVASGGRRRHLNIPGEDELEGKGVAFCSTCDAPLFKDTDVAVLGSGNSALEAVIDLFPYARNIYLLIRGEKPKGDPVNQEEVAKSSQTRIFAGVEVQKILGYGNVTGLQYKDKKTGETKELVVGGVFVEVGSVPNSEFVKDLVETNQAGEIIMDHRTARTSKDGIFAAGDVTDDPYKQNNIAAGDGVRSALSAYSYVLNFKKYSPAVEKAE
jgi:alkyl hydroperoxide reductase subunit F